MQRDANEDAKLEVKCQHCAYCGWDPDGNYCGSKPALEISGGFGKSLRVMRAASGPCGPEGKLWKQRVDGGVL